MDNLCYLKWREEWIIKHSVRSLLVWGIAIILAFILAFILQVSESPIISFFGLAILLRYSLFWIIVGREKEVMPGEVEHAFNLGRRNHA